MRRGPADGLRPASWSGTGPWPARVGGTGALRRNGDLFANSVRTCGRRGAGALRPGVSTYSLPCRSPPRGPCSSRADSGRRAGTEGPRAGVLLCRPAPPGSLQRRRPRRTEAIHRYHHIDGRCHLDLFKMLGTLDPDVHRSGARPRGVRRWARTAGGRRATPPGTGCRTGRDRRRAPGAAASVSASGDGLRIHARRAPGPTPGGTPPVRAGIVNRARTRPWQVDGRCSGTGPWPDGVAGQAPLAP